MKCRHAKDLELEWGGYLSYARGGIVNVEYADSKLAA